jgi:hypothetical protein
VKSEKADWQLKKCRLAAKKGQSGSYKRADRQLKKGRLEAEKGRTGS